MSVSHTKGEEEVEDLSCIRDHLQILLNEILNMREYLETAEKLSKVEFIKKIEETLSEANGIVHRLNYMLDDLKGEM
jgi:hypothetical protein